MAKKERGGVSRESHKLVKRSRDAVGGNTRKKKNFIPETTGKENSVKRGAVAQIRLKRRPLYPGADEAQRKKSFDGKDRRSHWPGGGSSINWPSRFTDLGRKSPNRRGIGRGVTTIRGSESSRLPRLGPGGRRKVKRG